MQWALASDMVGAVWDSTTDTGMARRPPRCTTNLGPRTYAPNQVKDTPAAAGRDWRLVLLARRPVR